MSWFRKKMWLAVEDGWAGWIDTPNSGADASPTGWGTEATLLNGGGYVANSWGTHKRYTFEWSDASSRQAAQFMQSLRNGAYGKGLIHFIEPTIYDTNILPARVAQPSLMVEDGGRPFVPDTQPVEVQASTPGNGPVIGARWDLPQNGVQGYPGRGYSTYIPIPDGYTLLVGAVYSATGSGGVFIRTPDGADVKIESSSTSGNPILGSGIIDSKGYNVARLWIGRLGIRQSSVTVFSITARLVPTRKLFVRGGNPYGTPEYGFGPYGGSELTPFAKRIMSAPWVGGMGHSGVRFNGTPTLIHNTGVNGGQVGYAASFIETGSWS